MGTTIRRQPISTKIPDSPDYKFLNITNFGGIEKSSNPFVVSSNTASDCLNVYVDEDNALSTRPRLSPLINLDDFARNLKNVEYLYTYKLHDGFITQFKHDVMYYTKTGPNEYVRAEVNENSVGEFYVASFYPNNGDFNDYLWDPVVLPENYVKTIHTLYIHYIDEKGRFTGTYISDKQPKIGYFASPIHTISKIPTEKCIVFEQDEKIYMLDKSGYYEISKDKYGYRFINFVEGYVPTTTVGKNKQTKTITSDGLISYTLDTEGTTYEPLNILSNKYKETYFWDGESNIQYPSGAVSIENNYYTWKSYSTNVPGTIVVTYNDGSFLLKADDLTNNPNMLYCVPNVDGVLTTYDTGLTVSALTKFDIHNNSTQFSKNKVVICLGNSNTLNVYKLSDNFVFVHQKTISFDGEIKRAIISNTSKYILVTYIIGDDEYAHKIYQYDNVLNTINEIEFEDSRHKFDALVQIPLAVFNDDDSRIIVTFSAYPDRETYISRLAEVKISDNKVTWEYITAVGAPDTYYMQLSPDGRFLIAGGMYGSIVELETDTVFRFDVRTTLYPKPDLTGIKITNPYITNNDVYWVRPTDNSVVCISIENLLNSSYNNLLKFTSYKNTLDNMTPIKNISNHNIILANGDFTSIISSSEPLIIVTKELQNDEQQFEKLNQLQSKLLQSNIFNRFDNNIWFTSGNYVFHTLYNDPTYIPLSNYNTLGTDYTDITGLCILNDNILAAYKRDKVYIITPISVGDVVTYSYTETKNVIGNDVVNAPILTTLTEMPVIVSYDGIYALNQLENVQSSDRITMLISEAINPLWLKESRDDIDNCITLNRLYWTYFILPHKKQADEKEDYSKVYLLDNRTQQWYYWELPILINFADVWTDFVGKFVPENCVVVRDVLGDFYSLVNTDILKEHETVYHDSFGVRKNYQNEYVVHPDLYTGSFVEKSLKTKLIPWYWTSQILSLNTINYSKRLVDTTFILTDTDTQDSYGLDYSFKAWRKSVSETNATTLSSNIHYVQSTTKRTMIPRFNFIQIKIQNIEDESALDNNKLRLVGLGLKYVLLEGLY